MKKIISILLSAILLLGLLAGCGKPVELDTSDPVASAKAWIEAQIENNTLFSFDYDGADYASHVKKWAKTVETTDNGWTVTYKNGDVTAWSEITFDEEMAALEWTNYFKNEGSSDSPVISNIQAIDAPVAIANPVLTTAKGSNDASDDFAPFSVNLVEEGQRTLETSGGRSSQDALPYFDVCNGEHGIMMAIGWTGDWRANFAHEEGVVTVTAGMQNTNLALYAGETIRTPMIMLQFFSGSQNDGHNAFRRLIIKNYTPKDEEGKPITDLPIFAGCDDASNEEAIMRSIQNKLDSGREVDGIWIDATWYGGLTTEHKISDYTWNTYLGDWYFNPDRFSDGNIAEVGEWAKEKGLELLIWFEPERVYAESEMGKAHPEWLLKLDEKFGNPNKYDLRLFDLSKDEACDYLIDLISGVLQENKITWYRQDFNTNPANAWAAADGSDTRVGATEIHYVTNLYRYLDGLVENNPGLMIDNCASGGRRMDLEMVKRSFTYWRTDFSSQSFGTADQIRAINYNLTWWLPLHGGGYPHYNNAGLTYNLRCQMSSFYNLGNQSPEAVVQKLHKENRICSEMMAYDFYMLPYTVDLDNATDNVAYQFNVPEEGRGYILTFRPMSSVEAQTTYQIQGLERDAMYKLEVADSGDTLTLSGADLMDKGLMCEYPEAAFSMLIYYNKI